MSHTEFKYQLEQNCRSLPPLNDRQVDELRDFFKMLSGGPNSEYRRLGVPCALGRVEALHA